MLDFFGLCLIDFHQTYIPRKYARQSMQDLVNTENIVDFMRIMSAVALSYIERTTLTQLCQLLFQKKDILVLPKSNFLTTFQMIKVHIQQELTFSNQLQDGIMRLNTLFASQPQDLELFLHSKLFNSISRHIQLTAVIFFFPHRKLEVSGAPIKECNGFYDIYDSHDNNPMYTTGQYSLQCIDRRWVLTEDTTKKEYYKSGNLHYKPFPPEVTHWKNADDRDIAMKVKWYYTPDEMHQLWQSKRSMSIHRVEFVFLITHTDRWKKILEDFTKLQIDQQFLSLQTGHAIPQAIVTLLDCLTTINFNLQSILDTRQRLHTDLYNGFSDETVCVICHDTQATQVLYPCRHLAACFSCTQTYLKSTQRCPLCRTQITSIKNLIHFRETEQLPPFISGKSSIQCLLSQLSTLCTERARRERM